MMAQIVNKEQSINEDTETKKLVPLNNKKDGIPLLEKLFEEKETWEDQDEIISALNSKGYQIVQGNLSRWLKELGAKKVEKAGWVSGEDYVSKKNLRGLKENIVSGGIFSYKLSCGKLLTAVFTTKQYHNHIIADKMKQAFEDEILFTVCPNDENIIVYYCKGKDESGKERKKSRFSTGIKEIFRAMQKQHGK